MIFSFSYKYVAWFVVIEAFRLYGFVGIWFFSFFRNDFSKTGWADLSKLSMKVPWVKPALTGRDMCCTKIVIKAADHTVSSDNKKPLVCKQMQIHLLSPAPPKGAKVYPASRRRSSKRMGLKGQLAPHCVPWLKNSIMAYKRLSTSLGSKTLNTSSLGLGGEPQFKTLL